MLCRFCERQKKLIDAHVIPQCLYALRKDRTKPMFTLSKDPGVHPRRSQTGEYDQSILCADCDNKLGLWDEYACDLLVEKIPRQAVKTGPNGQQCYSLLSYDYDKFKLFFLSVLWRMSISTRPLFRNVKLGAFETQLRQRLSEKDPGVPEDFAVFIYRYVDEFGSGMTLGTRPERLNGIKVYNVGLPGYLAVIKVDGRGLPLPVGPLVLARGKPLFIGIRDMRKNSELPFVQRIVVGNYTRRNKPKR
jgi:hypothetical protein